LPLATLYGQCGLRRYLRCAGERLYRVNTASLLAFIREHPCSSVEENITLDKKQPLFYPDGVEQNVIRLALSS